MSKERIYKHFGEAEQLKRLAKACGKLAYACGELRANKNPETIAYLIRKIANVEFLTEQIKDYYKCEDQVYIRKYRLLDELVKEIEDLINR